MDDLCERCEREVSRSGRLCWGCLDIVLNRVSYKQTVERRDDNAELWSIESGQAEYEQLVRENENMDD